MTTPDLPAGRPIPDRDDLRLLAELINNETIPLANAAWNARMSRAEAALRLVSMAERGLPLRLVADGDRQALWHIAQAGPATSGVPVTGGSTGVPGPGGPPVAPPAGAPAPPSAPVVLPPTPPVPPHEQAIAGAVPLGEPPFGVPELAPDPDMDAPDPPPADGPGVAEPASPESPSPTEDVGSLWGPAGSASWARVDGQAAPAPRWEGHPVSGPAGEQLTVTILDVIDPGDRMLTDAGYRMEPGERAVLVHSSVRNTGQVHYFPIGDLYLVLESDQGVLLGRANVAVASHPAHPVGVAPGRTADGWSVFLIPSETVLTGLKWCIRPDIPQTIVSWAIAP